MRQLCVLSDIWICLVEPAQELSKRSSVPPLLHSLDRLGVLLTQRELLRNKVATFICEAVGPNLLVGSPRRKFGVVCSPRFGGLLLLTALRQRLFASWLFCDQLKVFEEIQIGVDLVIEGSKVVRPKVVA